MRYVLFALFLCFASPALAQQNCPATPAAGTNNTTCANTAFVQKQMAASTIPWGHITGTPTTLGGYGITNARTQLIGNTTFYINGNSVATANCNGQTCQPGSDTNDGLSINTPFLTLSRGIKAITQSYDQGAFTATIQLSDAIAGSAAAANYSASCLGVVLGSAVVGITIIGNGTNQTNVHITAPNGGDGIFVGDGCIVFLQFVQIDDAGSALDAVRASEHGIIDLEPVTIGAFNSSAVLILAQKNGGVNFKGLSSTFLGGAKQALLAQDTGLIQINTPTQINIPNNASFTNFASAVRGGQLLQFTPASFNVVGTVTTTGPRALFTGSVLNFSGNTCVSTFPGSTACAFTDFATDDTGEAPTTPLPAATTTFANLPTPVAGMYAYISDGKASNCADTTCTTFGTAVTGGTGALPLFIWYTGAAWHLVGK